MTTDSPYSLQEQRMQDVIWIAVTIAFFVASIAYVHFCDRVK
jgi:hypothetical protein